MSPIGDDILDGLVAAASEARERFYAPYSGFAVGAAILAGGTTFVGVNIENASYPLSVCAERNAVAAMIVGGERRIEAVAVVAGGDGPASPCGGCRQVLAEFAARRRAGGLRARRGGARAMDGRRAAPRRVPPDAVTEPKP